MLATVTCGSSAELAGENDVTLPAPEHGDVGSHAGQPYSPGPGSLILPRLNATEKQGFMIWTE